MDFDHHSCDRTWSSAGYTDATFPRRIDRIKDVQDPPLPAPVDLASPEPVAVNPQLRVMEWTGRDTLIVFLVLLIAFGIRFIRLSEPEGLVFDETYYAKDACLYVGRDPEFCKLEQTTEQSYVHPPMGKWIIASGIKAFGFTPFGWRAPSALFGSLTALLAFLLARRLFRDRWVAGAAGLFVATDFLLIVQSRVAMLDIFQVFFVVLGFYFLSLDRERILLQEEHLKLPFPGIPPERQYEWRIAAGASLGLALSIKWSAAWALAGAGIMAGIWSLGLIAQRSLKARTSTYRPGGAVKELLVLAVSMLIVPGVIYLTSYSLYFADTLANDCPYRTPNEQCVRGFEGSARSFLDLQDRMLDYHMDLKVTHKYQSKAYTWPLIKRPVAYFYEASPGSKHILAFGNPLIWWPSLLAAIWLLVRCFRNYAPQRVIAVGWASQYLPWLLVERPLFLFYMAPVVPFMMIALAAAIGELRSLGRFLRVLSWLFLVGACGVALWFWYPVIAAVEIPYDQWQTRMIMDSWI